MSHTAASTTWILKLKDELIGPVKKTDVAVNELADNTDKLNTRIDTTSDVSKQATDELQDLVGAVRSGDLKSIQTGFTGIGNSIKGAAKASAAFIASPIGLTIAALAGVAIATKEWTEYNQAAKQANITTQQITKLSGEAISDARVRAQALEKTFGKDYQDNLLVSKNIVQAFKVSYQEAFDTIEDGLVRGGSANDEYMRSLREYPRLFAQNGFSLKEFQRIINTGIDMGIYDDKLPDAVKEFSLSINEQTDSAKQALENAFGKSYARELFGKVNDGSYSARDALIDIARKYENVEISAQQAGQLTADLFRGAGEDAGGFSVIMESVNRSLIEQEKALTPLEQMIRRTADADRELAQAQKQALESDDYITFSNEMSLFWKKIKTEFYNGVSYTTGLFNQWTDHLAVKAYQIVGLAKMLPTVVKVYFSNIVKEAYQVITTFDVLGDVFKKLLKLDFDGARDSAKDFKKRFKKEIGDLNGSVLILPEMVGDAYKGLGKKAKDSREKNRQGAVDQNKAVSDMLDTMFSDQAKNGDKKNKTTQGETGEATPGKGGKVITMTLNIQNYFNVNGDRIRNNIEDIADQVVGRINDRLRDALIALD